MTIRVCRRPVILIIDFSVKLHTRLSSRLYHTHTLPSSLLSRDGMEHLPSPLQPLVNILKAPLLARTENDDTVSPKSSKRGFLSSPLREGWTPRPADEWR